ncbi:hypothetical protein ACVIIW_006671 [Bradyrhizobium sp. USDA 4449]
MTSRLIFPPRASCDSHPRRIGTFSKARGERLTSATATVGRRYRGDAIRGMKASIERLVHGCPDIPPSLGSVLRVFKFEFGDKPPKLNLVTVRQLPGALGCGRVVWAFKIDDAPQPAVFVQNVCTIVWHRGFP